MKLLKDAYYISTNLKKSDIALEYVTKLVSLDEVNKEKWTNDLYYLLLNKKDYAQAESLLKENDNQSTAWKERLASFLLMKQSYIKSSQKYTELYNGSKNYAQKKQYLKQALSALQAGGYLKKSASLAKKYEKRFMNDKEMRKYILKLYIASGDLDKAASLSDYIFTKEMR